MDKRKMKKLLILNLPYFLVGLFATNLGEAWRLAEGADSSAKILSFFHALPIALNNPFPSFHPLDLLIGILCGAGLRLAVYLKGKNAKKYRHNVEYGSARWGTAKDIEPFIAPKFEDNVILTKTERLMMSNRPKNPANARNKNVLIIGGSGSGKTRFWLKPNLLQMHSSYVVTDPKGSIVIECGNALLKHGYTIKIFNTINFQKSMHYNPFAYIHSEKDILKLVTTLIANTKGDGKAGDEFWTKAETLLYCALIGYIHYEAPVEEQNFSTLIEFLNAMEVREDDEEFQNPVDLMFEALEKKKPNHFAVRQYKKYKLAAGVVCSKRLLNQAVGKSLRTHNLKPKKGAQVMKKNEKITALYERLSRDDFGKLPDARYRALDAQYAKEQDALEIEIAELEKAVTGYEQSQKSAEKFIALIDKYENFDTLTNTMLNEFVEKILVHERARKGSQDTTQEIEIYFNFLGRYIPPSLQPVPLTPEEQEELRKKEERKDRLHQNYLKRKASGAQKRYENKIKAKKKAEMDAKKALIRAEDMKKGVFSTVGQLPKEEPRKGSIAASAAV